MGLFSSNKPKQDEAVPHKPEPLAQPSTHTPASIPATAPLAAATTPSPQVTNAPEAPKSSTRMSNTNTTIGAGSIIEGQLKIEGEIFIEGTVKGTITSKSKVVLGASGKIEGDINCLEAEISGTVKGKINVKEILHLKANAAVDGDIITGKLVMESGVKFNGKCSMGAAVNVAPSSNGSSNGANGSVNSNGVPTPAAAAPVNG
jgi:cytoskeletal protein CcmA (bactofilin family)